MPITGLDDISLKILDSLDKGIKVKDVPTIFPVSLDQAKRLSRYHHILEKSKKNLEQDEVDKIRTTIGMKILYLSPLFQQEDWEGVTEVLSSIDEHTKRDKYPFLIKALQEKRERIKGFQLEIDSKLNGLKRREIKLQELEASIKETIKKIKKETTFLNRYPEVAQRFLIKHLGIYNEKLVLSKRLDSLWQRSLKKKGILSFSEYIWLVTDLDALVTDYLKRIQRKVPLATEWDYDKEEKRNKNGDYHTPSNSEYRLPTGLSLDLRTSLEGLEEQIKEIEVEKEKIHQEMKQLKETSPQTFIEAIQAKNTLSPYELKQHGEMQEKALKWLSNRGYVVASEVTLPNKKRADVIGYNEDGHIVIIEVKASLTDFRQDEKWQSYLEYSDEFYFLLHKDARSLYYLKEDFKGVGLLKLTKSSLKVEKKHNLIHSSKEREVIYFSVAKTLSNKFVYGF